MLKKITSATIFSMENHENTVAEELPAEGVVETADSEEVVAVATPSEDVTEAGDDVGQATPNEVIDAEPDADITTTETTVVEGTDDANIDEINKLTEDGSQAAQTTTEIVETALAEVAGDTGADTDINGNAITPEQAAENEVEEQIDEEVDEEAAKSAADKDLEEQVEDVTENVEEELGDAIGDDSSDGGVDGAATDDTSTDIDAGGDQGDMGMDANLGGETDPIGADDVEATDDTELDDDVPLEGAEPETTDVDETTTEEAATGEDIDGDLEGTEVESVTEQVDDQNAAADVTAEAASADAEQTEFIAGDTPEQHGEEPASDIVPNDGEEVVAEAAPAVQNETDVSTANANADIDGATTTIDDVELDDDTPLEGAEPLAVNDEASLTPTEVDGIEATGPTGDGATVEESQSDQQAEELDQITETETPDEVETQDEEIVETSDSPDGSDTEEVVDETESVNDTADTGEVVGIDAEAGEIEEEGEADFEEGELDIPDVDTETTEEEVEEAEIEADEVEAEADAEEEQAELADKTIEELQKEQESLEEYRVLLEYGIANEAYEPGLLAYINAKANDTREMLNGAGCKIEAVALEAYTGKDLDLAYSASLESINSMLTRIDSFTKQLIRKVEGWYSRSMVDKIKSRSSALNKLVDVCLVQLKDSGTGTKEVNAIGAYLSYADGNLVKAVADDLGAISEMSTKGLKASEALQGYMVKALNDISGARTPAEATKVANAVADYKDTRSAFPNRGFDNGFLGGYKLQLKDATKGSELKDRVLNMARRAVPVVVKEGKGGKSSQSLSKGDVANLLKFAKAYVALADKLADTAGDRAVDSISKVKLSRNNVVTAGAEGNVRGGDEKAINATSQALEIVAKAHNDIYKFITKHCFDVAEALCGVAKKFVK